MKLQKNILISMAFLVGSLFSTVSLAEEGAVCKFENSNLICAKSIKDGKTILDAMSNPKTLALLQDTLAGGAFSKEGDQRESYRLSLEANRNAMTKYADKKWRSYRRKKTSAEVYEAIRDQYRAGMTAYWEGIKIYRAGTWTSPVKPYQSD